jgi:hypothetical protein
MDTETHCETPDPEDWDKMRALSHRLIEDSITPANPYRADLATIDRIKSSSQFWASGQWY